MNILDKILGFDVDEEIKKTEAKKRELLKQKAEEGMGKDEMRALLLENGLRVIAVIAGASAVMADAGSSLGNKMYAISKTAEEVIKDADEDIKAIFGEEPKPEGESEAEEDGQKDAE